MVRLPVVGGDKGDWGTILNDYLSQSHEVDGSLKVDTVGAAQLKPSSVINSSIANASVTTAKLADGAVTSAKINGVGTANGIATLDVNGTIPEAQVPSRLTVEELSQTYVRPSASDGMGQVAPLPWVNPKDFGAVFDNVTDDLPAWQAAADVAASIGGTILHPGGESFLGGTLILRNKTALVGGGPLLSRMRFPNSYSAGNFIQSEAWGTDALDVGIRLRGFTAYATSLSGINSGWVETYTVGDYAPGMTVITVGDSTHFPATGSVWAGHQVVTYAAKNVITTTLSANANNADTSITLTSTAGLAPAGGILIGGIAIAYSGISGNTLTGISATGMRSIMNGGFTSGESAVQHQLTGCSSVSSSVPPGTTVIIRGSTGHGIALQCNQADIDDVFVYNTNGANIILDGPGAVENRITKCRLTTAGQFNIYVTPGATDGHINDTATGPSIIDQVVLRGQNWQLKDVHPIGPNPARAAGPFRYQQHAFVIAAPGIHINGCELDTVPATQFLIDSTINGMVVHQTHIGRGSILAANGESPSVAGIGNFLTFRSSSYAASGRVTVGQFDLTFNRWYYVVAAKMPNTRIIRTTNLSNTSDIQVVGNVDFPQVGRIACGNSYHMAYTGKIQRHDWLASSVSGGATSVTLEDASAFPTSGWVGIVGGAFEYTGKSGNTLTGMNITTAYPAGTGVTQNFLTGVRGGTTIESATTPVFLLHDGGGESLAGSMLHFPAEGFFQGERFLFDAGHVSLAACTIGGYRMETGGSATITPGTSTISVAHNLEEVPAVFSAVPSSTLGALTYTVTATAENIVIALSGIAPEAVSFSWSAHLLQ